MLFDKLYKAFGIPTIRNASNKIVTTSSIGNRYMFTGREYDTETSLYYYRLRYYDPNIGRFLQTDPLGYWDSMNLYAYCNNNPVNWRDPWGLARIITRPVKLGGEGGITIGRHGYIRFDDGTTGALNRVNGKTYVGPETKPLSADWEKYYGRDAGVPDELLKKSYHNAKRENNPSADDVDGKPYDSTPRVTNNSNDWINKRLSECGGQDILDWDGSFKDTGSISHPREPKGWM